MTDRKKELLKTITESFVEKGLHCTSMRDIGKVVGMETSALYYYFKNKEEIVTLCAELAISQLSQYMAEKTLMFVSDPENLAENIMKEASSRIPLMRFIVAARVSKKYGDNVTGAIKEFSARYDTYVQMIADKLGCDAERIRPIVYMMIVSTVNYMIFGEESLFTQQFAPIKAALTNIISGEKK